MLNNCKWYGRIILDTVQATSCSQSWSIQLRAVLLNSKIVRMSAPGCRSVEVLKLKCSIECSWLQTSGKQLPSSPTAVLGRLSAIVTAPALQSRATATAPKPTNLPPPSLISQGTKCCLSNNRPTQIFRRFCLEETWGGGRGARRQ